MFYLIRIILIPFILLNSSLNASRLWGVIQKDNSPLILDYNIIYKQLLELQLQGNLGNFADWPYNSDDGWGLVKYSDITLNPESDIFNSPLPAINDPEFITSINKILSYEENTRIALGHVRKSTSGSYTIPNPHPFNFFYNNRTYSFAHNGTIDKVGLMSLLTQNGTDSSWIRQNHPDSYNCGHWETSGFDCIVDSELYFLWIMKNIIEIGDDLRGILNAIKTLENTDFEVDEYYGEQRNFVFSNGLELFGYKSADNITGENRHELYFKSYENHFSVMSTPFSVDSGYNVIENQQLIILSSSNSIPIKINTNLYEDSLLDNQVLNDIISINELNEDNCVSCNNNGILEEFELGNQEWENNRLISLDLSNYSQQELSILPSSIHLLTELISYTGPNSKIIPELYCNELPAVISSQVQCDVYGCTNPTACNYNSFASNDNGTCTFSNPNEDCENNCIYDIDENNECDNITNIGCTDSLAINFNSTANINQNCFYDNFLLLKKGNNLVSLPGELENNNTIDILTQLTDQNLPVNFILGQGVGIFKIDNEWSGNLHNFDIKKGYWINTQSNFAWHVPIDNPPLTGYECIPYQLSEGNNLVSYISVNNNSTINSLNGELYSSNFEFILGQSVGLFNTEHGWTGNLYNLSLKKGYWLNSLYPMDFYWGTECGESIILDSLNKNLANKKFRVNQSTNQSFYIINEIQLNEADPSEDDFLLAYNEEELIGYVNYSPEKIILPIMGKDISEQTFNYIGQGETPKLKYYFINTGKTVDLIGSIPNFQNLTVHQIDLLKSNLRSLPTEFKIKPIYPNPFNSKTTIEFSIQNESTVIIELFDIKGKKIKSIFDKKLNSGNHQLIIETGLLPSGIYFINTNILDEQYKIINKNSQKILLIK